MLETKLRPPGRRAGPGRPARPAGAPGRRQRPAPDPGHRPGRMGQDDAGGRLARRARPEGAGLGGPRRRRQRPGPLLALRRPRPCAAPARPSRTQAVGALAGGGETAEAGLSALINALAAAARPHAPRARRLPPDRRRLDPRRHGLPLRQRARRPARGDDQPGRAADRPRAPAGARRPGGAARRRPALLGAARPAPCWPSAGLGLGRRRGRAACARAPRAGPRASTWRACPCAGATTRRASSPTSPATTAWSWTTSPPRCWRACPPSAASSCCAPRSSAGSPARCATPSPARRGSARVLAELERSNLFLVPLDNRREWYRYHHLFGELLQHELALSRAGRGARAPPPRGRLAPRRGLGGRRDPPRGRRGRPRPGGRPDRRALVGAPAPRAGPSPPSAGSSCCRPRPCAADVAAVPGRGLARDQPGPARARPTAGWTPPRRAGGPATTPSSRPAGSPRARWSACWRATRPRRCGSGCEALAATEGDETWWRAAGVPGGRHRPPRRRPDGRGVPDPRGVRRGRPAHRRLGAGAGGPLPPGRPGRRARRPRVGRAARPRGAGLRRGGEPRRVPARGRRRTPGSPRSLAARGRPRRGPGPRRPRRRAGRGAAGRPPRSPTR